MAGVTIAGPPAVVIGEAPFPAAVTAIHDEHITFTTDQRARNVAAADLVRWGIPPDPPPRPMVVFTAGGWAVADVVAADRNTMRIESLTLGAAQLPRAALAGMIFHPPGDRQRLEALLERIARGTRSDDRLVFTNDDEVAGTLQTIAGESLHIQAEVGPLTLAVDRIAAVLLQTVPAAATGPAPQMWVGLADGSRLLAQRVTRDGQALRLTLPTGAQLSTDADQLAWLQPSGGRAEYLSDLPVADYRHVPYLSLAWPYALDHSVAGHALRCGGRPYLKGIGLHSAARITYRLDKPCQRFEAEIGVDDETAGGGSVRFRVFVDGQPRYTSPILRGGQPPLPIAVDIPNARRLDLVVDYGEAADVLDHADWADARVIHAAPQGR